MSDETKPAHVGIPSDALRAVLNLRDEVPFFRQLLGEIVQTVMVLDASAIQSELRWRLASRINPTARTGLHEAIDAGVVLAFAPIFLKQEIEKYLPVIARETGVTIEVATAEWQRVQCLIRFHAPIGDGTKFALVDPKDSEYALTATELDADFVRTMDKDFARMGLSVVGPELDSVLRDYARATSVIVTVKLGSGYAVTFSLAAFAEMMRGIIEIIRKLPTPVKIILGMTVMAVILHPTSRGKLIRWTRMLRERLREARPAVLSILQEFFKYLDEAAKTSRITRETIKSRLQTRGNQTALSHARFVCVWSKTPLAADEIARRILTNGYSSRSKNFTAYVRRLLREDRRFATNADGLWTFRTAV